ncbi:unnamed protein product [Phytophthora lilii]|uniref:Unnamed protein product n=1 Tax=Phytophthora lilii TaxID=2077276 RepID=A0A9W6TYA8_9STRA|nr:unnamed protein product [Phytophthora lilii]
MVETVSSVCESFQQAVEAQAAPAEDAGGYDQYYDNCRRLVDYIQQHMEASPGFSEQMDRIILACHSGATERVLSSVVTKQLWFHVRGDAPPHVEAERKSSSSSSGPAAAKKKVNREFPPCMATRASAESPAMHTRSAAGSKRSTRTSVQDVQPVKRPRRAARKVIQDTSDEEEEKEEEKPTRARKGRKKQVEEEEDDDDLLTFDDAIGDLCYPERRDVGATRFFKDRLRKSIQFVDALLCKPPPGKVCGRGCKKIRAQMCSSSSPCKNKMCRIWHDVEAHTDRCQNPQCEFKNRILLRETMHKLEMKEQQIAALKVELENKHAELKEAAKEDKGPLEDSIVSLEHDLEECESELDVLQTTKKTFWGNLNEIGIEVSDDVADNFPDFATHYVEKKAPRKARKAIDSASPHPSNAPGPHGGDGEDEEEAGDGDAESVGDSIPRRTARRSTSSGRHTAPLHHESDEETKGNDEETKDGEDRVYTRPDEPPRPPAGPPPFKQNPELDRAYAVGASGYSIHPPPADDLETPALAMDPEPTVQPELNDENRPNEVQESTNAQQLADSQHSADAQESVDAQQLPTARQLADAQQASDGLVAGLSSNSSPAEPVNTTGFTIRGNPPQNP